MELFSILDLNKVLNQNDKIYVYGLGTSSRLFIDLSVMYKIDLSACVVGNGIEHPSQYHGIPVFMIQELETIEEDSVLVYTVKKPQEQILADELTECFKEVIDISSLEIYEQMLKMYYSSYFKRDDIIIDSNAIRIKQCQFLNFITMGEEYEKAFLQEIGDVVLPPVLNDYSRIDEGSYEDEDVVIKPNDYVIDCGANLGLFSVVAANKGAIVYAFEPIWEILNILNKQAALYDGQIFVEPYALSDVTGSGTFSKKANSITNATCDSTDNTFFEKIQMITLDEFVEQEQLAKVDFIKADIEGSERQLLMGAKETLKKFAPKLSICTYHHPDDPQVLEDLVKNANPQYIVRHKWKKMFAFVPDKMKG